MTPWDPSFLTDAIRKELEEKTAYPIVWPPDGVILQSGTDYSLVWDPTNEQAKAAIADVRMRFGKAAAPYKDEMEAQTKAGRPRVIVVRPPMGEATIFAWGDYLLDTPLIDREFHHGVTDCWDLIRAWKWQNEGRKYANIPRDPDWFLVGGRTQNFNAVTDKFKENENLYLRHIKEQGLREYVPRDPFLFDVLGNSPDLPRKGDIILMQVEAPVVNHGGVLVGPGRVLHQMRAKPSDLVDLKVLYRAGYVRKWYRNSDV